jgi:ubiquinone/menaquinone biosynthesis C-methylase UbiE
MDRRTGIRRDPVYDRIAGRYESIMRPLENCFFRKLRSKTLSALSPGSRILEIGAGTGLNFPHYPKDCRGVATEFSLEMLKVARGKQRPERIALVQSRAEEIPFANASFDAAFATLVFCSVSSPPAAFAELRRVIKPGGTVALMEHVRPRNLLGPVFDLLSLVTVPLIEDHVNRRTADEARRAGLDPVNIEPRLWGIFEIIICRV